MNRRLFILFATLALAGANVLRADDVWVVREDGVGPAKVGMTLSQLNTALGEKFVMPWRKDDQTCFFVKPAKHPHFAFMIENGRFSRVDVDAPGISTSEGIHIGNSEAQARRVYGARMKVEPHAYIEGGHYLTVRSADGRFGTRFETSNGKIISFYAGRFESIQYIEHCE
jgi:hypothetical protein